MRTLKLLGLAFLAALLLVPHGSEAQTAAQVATDSLGSTRADQAATVTFVNRPITTLRAIVLTRTPAERAEAAAERLHQLVARGTTSPVEARPLQDQLLITVGSELVFSLAPADVDELAGETLEQKGQRAVAALTVALQESLELRAPATLLRAALQAVVATAVFIAILWGLIRAQRVLSGRLVAETRRRMEQLRVDELGLVRASRVLDLTHRLATLVALVAGAIVSYSWATFVLRRFPYTRPYGESLREFLLDRVVHLGSRLVGVVPDVVTVVMILLITRFAVRINRIFFEAVESERVSIPWIHADVAQPTQRLVATLMWGFGLVAMYPYLPGANTSAFQGLTVFAGLVISLGSTAIIGQIMSNFTIIYSRALKPGDFVRIGDVEGTVEKVGLLSTKVLTPRREEINIPNLVVVSATVTNYSRFAKEGVYVPTSVTIGYDAPWRLVHSMLVTAAERTPGVRPEPKPVVVQTALEDFYVRYTLLVALEEPALRVRTLGVLHSNVQDLFNEHGVQIMSPNYEADPAAPKLVPKNRWNG